MHVWLLLQLFYDTQALPQISPCLSDKAKNCKNEKYPRFSSVTAEANLKPYC